MNVDVLHLECIGTAFDPLIAKWWILMILPMVAALISVVAGIVRTMLTQTSNKLAPRCAIEGEYWQSHAEDQEVVRMLLGRPGKNSRGHATWKSRAMELFLAYCLFLQVGVYVWYMTFQGDSIDESRLSVGAKFDRSIAAI